MRPVMTLLVIVSLTMTTRGQASSTKIDYRPEVLVQLGVANLDRALEFYTATLGFELTERRDDLKFAHLDTNLPGLQIGLNEVAAPKGSGSTVINISVKNVADTRERLEARGLKFRGPTVIIPRKVSLAEFADPDGNVLRFAGPPPPDRD